MLLPNFATSALLHRRLRAQCTVSTPRGAYGESSRQHRATSQQHHKAPGYLLAIECQQRQLLDARPRGEREVVSLKILDAKEDLQRDNLALASQPAAISRLGPAVAG